MDRICYCSAVLPGKTDAIRAHWANKPAHKDQAIQTAEIEFWSALQMTGFDCWLQPKDNLMIHCLEGSDLGKVFYRLREQINAGNSIAKQLNAYYQEVLGKDYRDQTTEPRIECVFDVAIPATSSNIVKKGFVYPLLPHKEEEHRAFRKESMGPMRARHEASLRAFGVFRLTTWLQNTKDGKYIVCYSEREADIGTAKERLARGESSSEWHDISRLLMDHTGLDYESLSPDVEWLTKEWQNG